MTTLGVILLQVPSNLFSNTKFLTESLNLPLKLVYLGSAPQGFVCLHFLKFGIICMYCHAYKFESLGIELSFMSMWQTL